MKGKESMPKLYFGSRGGVYYKRKGRKVYVSRFGRKQEQIQGEVRDYKRYGWPSVEIKLNPYEEGYVNELKDNIIEMFSTIVTANNKISDLTEEIETLKEKKKTIKYKVQQDIYDSLIDIRKEQIKEYGEIIVKLKLKTREFVEFIKEEDKNLHDHVVRGVEEILEKIYEEIEEEEEAQSFGYY